MIVFTTPPAVLPDEVLEMLLLALPFAAGPLAEPARTAAVFLFAAPAPFF